MITNSISKNCLEDMLKILGKCGNKWPPYPQDFKIPEGIKSMWGYENYPIKHEVAILRGNFNV